MLLTLQTCEMWCQLQWLAYFQPRCQLPTTHPFNHTDRFPFLTTNPLPSTGAQTLTDELCPATDEPLQATEGLRHLTEGLHHLTEGLCHRTKDPLQVTDLFITNCFRSDYKKGLDMDELFYISHQSIIWTNCLLTFAYLNFSIVSDCNQVMYALSITAKWLIDTKSSS